MVQLVSSEGQLLQQLEYRGFGRMAGSDGEDLRLVADAHEKGHRLRVATCRQLQRNKAKRGSGYRGRSATNGTRKLAQAKQSQTAVCFGRAALSQ